MSRTVAPPELAQLRVVERLGAEGDPRDAGTVERSRIAALVRPRVGLDRDLGVVREPEPFTNATQETLDLARAGISDGVPPPRYTDPSGGRRRVPGAPNARSSASARRPSSTCNASRYWPIRLRGPRAAEPAMTTKSQYGQRETQKGTWM